MLVETAGGLNMPTMEVLSLISVAGLAAVLGASLWRLKSRHTRERVHLITRLRPRPLTDGDVLSVIRRMTATRQTAALMQGASSPRT